MIFEELKKEMNKEYINGITKQFIHDKVLKLKISSFQNLLLPSFFDFANQLIAKDDVMNSQNINFSLLNNKFCIQ